MRPGRLSTKGSLGQVLLACSVAPWSCSRSELGPRAPTECSIGLSPSPGLSFFGCADGAIQDAGRMGIQRFRSSVDKERSSWGVVGTFVQVGSGPPELASLRKSDPEAHLRQSPSLEGSRVEVSRPDFVQRTTPLDRISGVLRALLGTPETSRCCVVGGCGERWMVRSAHMSRTLMPHLARN